MGRWANPVTKTMGFLSPGCGERAVHCFIYQNPQGPEKCLKLFRHFVIRLVEQSPFGYVYTCVMLMRSRAQLTLTVNVTPGLAVGYGANPRVIYLDYTS